MKPSIMDRYLLLLEDKGSRYTPSPMLYVVQGLVLVMEFVTSIAIGLHTSDSSDVPGVVLISMVSVGACLYSWRASIWGARSSLWWLIGPGMLVLFTSLVGALIGVRFQTDTGSISASWHASYMFMKSLWGIYFVAWGIVRTLLVERINDSG